MQKKIFFGVNFIFLRRKTDFLAVFSAFTASVRSWPPGPPLVPGVYQYYLPEVLSLETFNLSNIECEEKFADLTRVFKLNKLTTKNKLRPS